MKNSCHLVEVSMSKIEMIDSIIFIENPKNILKFLYDSWYTGAILAEGDLVLVKDKHNIQEKWEEEYVVRSQPHAGIPVHEVELVIGGEKRELLLLPLGSKMEESLVSKSPMKQKSTKNVNIWPVENLMEISSEWLWWGNTTYVMITSRKEMT